MTGYALQETTTFLHSLGKAQFEFFLILQKTASLDQMRIHSHHSHEAVYKLNRANSQMRDFIRIIKTYLEHGLVINKELNRNSKLNVVDSELQA